MDLINHTPYPAVLFRGALDENKMIGSVGIKVTYQIQHGKLIPAAAQGWEIQEEPWESPYGKMDGDKVWKRGEVDVFVFGQAKAPRAVPVKRVEVAVEIPGKLKNKLVITGDRFWQESAFGLKASEPVPFTEMPLTNAHAYGGISQWDGLAFPHSINPDGKGFIWEREDAAGMPLPNIEHPAHLVTQWDDRPPVHGFVPIAHCERKISRSFSGNHRGQLTDFNPVFFNNAFNEMIVPTIAPGEKIIVTGMSHEGIFSCEVPAHDFLLKIQIGEKHYEKHPSIEQIGIEVDKQQAFIMYRYSFRYKMEPREIRTIDIQEQK